MSNSSEDPQPPLSSTPLDDDSLTKLRRSKVTTLRPGTRLKARTYDWEDSVEEHDDYDEANFYCGVASDAGSVSRSMRLPLDLDTMVQRIVQKDDVPAYRTSHDVIRDALVHRLHYLNENYRMPKSLSRMLAVEEARRKNHDAQALMREQEELVKEVEETLKGFADSGSTKIRDRYITDMWRAVHSLEEPWQGRLRNMLSAYGPPPRNFDFDESTERREDL